MADLPTLRSQLTERPSAVRVVPLVDLRRLHRMALIILLVDKGVANAGHRKALMRQDFRKMGVSIKPWKGETDAIVLVQDFSCD